MSTGSVNIPDVAEGYDFSEPDDQLIYAVKGKKYLAVQAFGTQAAKYKSLMQQTIKFNEDRSTIEGAGDIEPIMVSICSFEIKADGTRGPLVKEDVVRSWPYKAIKKVFDWIIESSDLKEEPTIESLTKEITTLQKKLAKLQKGQTDVKNDQTETTTGSN